MSESRRAFMERIVILCTAAITAAMLLPTALNEWFRSSDPTVLRVRRNESYTVPDGEVEVYSRAEIYGQIQIHGTLDLS